MKIVADPNIPYVREAFAPLGEIELLPGRQMTAAAVRDAELLLVRSVTNVNAALLDGSRVRFVATATIGFDHIDRAYLDAHQIGFASAAGSNANSVAEYIIAALLELAYRGKTRLAGKTLGVVGVGNVGSKVARYARALGMRVLENDPPRQEAEGLPGFVSLDRVCAEADFITCHVPLTKSGKHATRYLFNKERLAGLKLRKPYLLNTARGAVVDNRALLDALNGDWVAGAVLDVWENEPDILPELRDVVELGTPHIAGYSFDGKVNGARMIYEAACRQFGLPASWRPQMPVAPVPRLKVRVEPGEEDEAVLRRVIGAVYDINADDARLRAGIREFDKQRAEYPVRREFGNTELELAGAGATLVEKLRALGFRLAL